MQDASRRGGRGVTPLLGLTLEMASQVGTRSGSMTAGSRATLIVLGVVIGLLPASGLLWVVSSKKRRDSARSNFEGATIKGGPVYSTPAWTIGGALLAILGLGMIAAGILG